MKESIMENHYTVYILKSIKLNRFYIGFTTDLEQRLIFHENAETHKFTAKSDDWMLFYKINCETKNQGLAVEKHIKSMKSSKYINNLLVYPEITAKLLERYRDC